jgi:AraC family ethanolamine operon transcriptional activator
MPNTRRSAAAPARAPQPAKPPVFARYASHDADEAAARLREWDQRYEQIAPGRFEGLTTDVWLGPVQLFREQTNQTIYEAGHAWPGSLTFGVPLDMQGTSRFCGRPMGLDDALVMGPKGELDFLTARSLDIVGIAIDCNWITDHHPGLLEGLSPDTLSALRTARLRPDAAQPLRAFFQQLFAELERDPTRLASRPFRDALRGQVLGNVLGAVDTGSDAQSAVPRHEVQRQLVERAKAYVMAHADTAITIADLCEALDVSRRTLQYAFEHVLDTTPVNYLRAVRLHAVRRSLRTSRRDELSIQDAATRWGFWHASHFANDYRRLFGCTPSQTPRRA